MYTRMRTKHMGGANIYFFMFWWVKIEFTVLFLPEICFLSFVYLPKEEKVSDHDDMMSWRVDTQFENYFSCATMTLSTWRIGFYSCDLLNYSERATAKMHSNVTKILNYSINREIE